MVAIVPSWTHGSLHLIPWPTASEHLPCYSVMLSLHGQQLVIDIFFSSSMQSYLAPHPMTNSMWVTLPFVLPYSSLMTSPLITNSLWVTLPFLPGHLITFMINSMWVVRPFLQLPPSHPMSNREWVTPPLLQIHHISSHDQQRVSDTTLAFIVTWQHIPQPTESEWYCPFSVRHSHYIISHRMWAMLPVCSVMQPHYPLTNSLWVTMPLSLQGSFVTLYSMINSL